MKPSGSDRKSFINAMNRCNAWKDHQGQAAAAIPQQKRASRARRADRRSQAATRQPRTGQVKKGSVEKRRGRSPRRIHSAKSCKTSTHQNISQLKSSNSNEYAQSSVTSSEDKQTDCSFRQNEQKNTTSAVQNVIMNSCYSVSQEPEKVEQAHLWRSSTQTQQACLQRSSTQTQQAHLWRNSTQTQQAHLWRNSTQTQQAHLWRNSTQTQQACLQRSSTQTQQACLQRSSTQTQQSLKTSQYFTLDIPQTAESAWCSDTQDQQQQKGTSKLLYIDDDDFLKQSIVNMIMNGSLSRKQLKTIYDMVLSCLLCWTKESDSQFTAAALPLLSCCSAPTPVSTNCSDNMPCYADAVQRDGSVFMPTEMTKECGGRPVVLVNHHTFFGEFDTDRLSTDDANYASRMREDQKGWLVETEPAGNSNYHIEQLFCSEEDERSDLLSREVESVVPTVKSEIEFEHSVNSRAVCGCAAKLHRETNDQDHIARSAVPISKVWLVPKVSTVTSDSQEYSAQAAKFVGEGEACFEESQFPKYRTQPASVMMPVLSSFQRVVPKPPSTLARSNSAGSWNHSAETLGYQQHLGPISKSFLSQNQGSVTPGVSSVAHAQTDQRAKDQSREPELDEQDFRAVEILVKLSRSRINSGQGAHVKTETCCE